MFLTISKYSFILAISFFASGCIKKVSRLQENTAVDISGRWNDTDSRLVANEILDSIFRGAWVEDFSKHHAVAGVSRLPVFVVGDIRNKSHEHIESDTFIKDIEREIINGRRAKIIANSALREQMRKESNAHPDLSNNKENSQKVGRQLGADFMLTGTINSIVDASEDDTLVVYQITIELIDLETREIVWMGDKKIKKYRSKSGKVRSHQQGSIPK